MCYKNSNTCISLTISICYKTEVTIWAKLYYAFACFPD